MADHWITDAVFYHIYPLGMCGAPERNDLRSAPVPRLEKLYSWLDHMEYLGVNALYLGPLFEATRHGYDTADYMRVDRRLGTNDTLRAFSAELHRRGIRLVLDAVLNHVGRDFWAFQDVRARGPESPYCEWFAGLRFGESSPYGDPFTYESWDGHYSLVKLNLQHPAVVEHLLGAVGQWMDEFQIDGLRLDAADVMDVGFLRTLAQFTHGRRSDFWLMGEVVHGDYRHWANPDTLDAVTNYECYKGLYSSHVDRNYFEIAYSLNRQFGPEGMYRGLRLYNFADNHDVNRVASNLTEEAHLFPLHCLLFTMPGVPSIYYGSEWGLAGERTPTSDRALRPDLDLAWCIEHGPHGMLPSVIGRLARLRGELVALREGDYQEVHVDHEQLVFMRRTPEQTVVVAINAAQEPVALDVTLPGIERGRAVDWLDGREAFPVDGGRLQLDPVWGQWARVLRVE